MIASSGSNGIQDPTEEGIDAHFSFSADPFSVRDTMTLRSSSLERVRITYPSCSSFFNNGVSVPLSR